jgi:signal transduction histidine kinase
MRLRVLAALVATAAVSIALFGLPLAELVQEYYRDQAAIEVQQHAASVAVGPLDPTTIDATNHVDVDHLVATYDTHGRRLGGTGPDQADAVVNAALHGSATRDLGDTGAIVVAVPTTSGAAPVAVVRGESPASVVDNRVRLAWAAIVGLAVTVVAVVATGAWFLSRRLVRPVESLTVDLAQLGAGDFDISPTRTGVAEIDQAHEALVTTATRLGDTLEQERAFSADVSHQLRTPITSLRLAIEGELAAPRADPTVALHEALEEIDRLEATTEDLLVLARQPAAARHAIDVAEIIDATAARWQPRFARVDRELVAGSSGDCTARVAPGRLAQTLDILLDNALKHATGSCHIDAVRRGDHVHIAVHDDGPTTGEAAAVERRLDGRRLGLDLARRLVETDGGRLRLPSSGASAYTVVVPARTIDHDDAPGDGASPSIAD